MAKNSSGRPELRIVLKGDAKQVLAQIKDVEKALNVIAGKPIKDPTGELRRGLKETAREAKNAGDEIARTDGRIVAMAKSIAAAIGFTEATRFIKGTADAAIEAQTAFRGLEVVANNAGIGIERAMRDVKELTVDRLISEADMMAAMRDFYSMGLNADQTKQLIQNLKDIGVVSVATGRSLGEALRLTAQGVKNGNSAISDTIGITENLSQMQERYAKSVGKTVSELSMYEQALAFAAAAAREVEGKQGEAARAAETLRGKFSEVSSAYQKLKAELGEAFTPAITTMSGHLNTLLDKISSIVKKLREVDALTFSINNGKFEDGLWLAKLKARWQWIKDTFNGSTYGERQERYERAIAEAEAKYKATIDRIWNPDATVSDNISPEAKAVANRKAQTQQREKEIADRHAAELAALERERKELQAAFDKGLRTREAYLNEIADLDRREIDKRREVLAERIALVQEMVAASAGQRDASDYAEQLKALEQQDNVLREKRLKIEVDAEQERTRRAEQERRRSRDARRALEQERTAQIEAELAADQNAHAIKLAQLEAALAKQEITEEEYLERRHARQQADLQAQAQAIQKQIEMYNRLAASAEQSGDLEDAKRYRAQITNLRAELDKLKAEGVVLNVEFDVDRYEVQRQLDEFKFNLKVRLLDAQGKTLEARLTEIQRELEETLKKTKDAETRTRAIQLAELETQNAKFEEAQKRMNLALERHAFILDNAHYDLEWGNIGPGAYDKRIQESKKETIAVLEQYIGQMEEAARATGSPEMALAVEKMREQLRRLKQDLSETAKAINKTFADSLVTAFESIVSKTATVKEAFKSMALAILREMQRIMHEKMAQQLFAWLGGSKVGWKGGLGGLFSWGTRAIGLGAATGGLVRGPGTETSDSIPARLSNGEFVLRAAAVRAIGVDVLQYMNRKGKLPERFAEGGLVGAASSTTGGGNSARTVIENRNIVLIDKKDIQDAMASSGGDRVTLNHIRANAGAIRSLLGL